MYLWQRLYIIIHSEYHNFPQAQQGELSVVAKLAEPGYELELTSAVPSVGLVSIIPGFDHFLSGRLI